MKTFILHAESLSHMHYALCIGEPNVNKVKNFLLFLKFMKRPQTKFHVHTMRESHVVRSKKSQNLSFGQSLSLGQYFLAAQLYSLY